MRHRARVSGGKFACCASILVYYLVRDWTRFCYVIGLKNIRIHPSTRYRIRCGLFFSTLVSGFKNIRLLCRFRRMRVDGSCIRQEKVADSKYPDKCGRGRRYTKSLKYSTKNSALRSVCLWINMCFLFYLDAILNRHSMIADFQCLLVHVNNPALKLQFP